MSEKILIDVSEQPLIEVVFEACTWIDMFAVYLFVGTDILMSRYGSEEEMREYYENIKKKVQHV